MKAICPFCGRRVRVCETATARPTLVKHAVRVSTGRRLGLPAKTECHGSQLAVVPANHQFVAQRFQPEFTSR